MIQTISNDWLERYGIASLARRRPSGALCRCRDPGAADGEPARGSATTARQMLGTIGAKLAGFPNSAEIDILAGQRHTQPIAPARAMGQYSKRRRE